MQHSKGETKEKKKQAGQEDKRDIKQRRDATGIPSANLAPPAGLEPATYGLTVRRSTD